MKRLLASTALALMAGLTAAHADEVVIRQNFDLAPHELQDVTNRLRAKTDVTNSALEGTNIQNLLQWRDVSTDGELYGDIYNFDQFTDEEQSVLNVVSSKYGDVGADLAATNIMNVVTIEDTLGGSEEVGDHFLIDQDIEDTLQTATNRISADDNVLAGSSAEITNLANVASITDKLGGVEAGNIVRLDQRAKDAVQLATTRVNAGGIQGIEVSATNGMNIASFDLSSQTGKADIELTQATYDVVQTISNTANVAGAAAGASLSGTNLGNIVTFVQEPAN